jgi:hypothetical protein
MLWLERLLWALPAIGALIWTGPALRVRRSGIFPTQLNDSELIRGSLTLVIKITIPIGGKPSEKSINYFRRGDNAADHRVGKRLG